MILSLFGTVAGFQSLVFGKPPTGLTDQWIDCRNALPLEPGDWAVVVRRKQVPEGVATWVGLYRQANEMVSSRGGVYGAGAWLINQWIPGDLIVRLLWAHADEMARIGVEGGQFTRTLNEIERQFQWPQSLGAEVMRALEPWLTGGLGVGDKPTALLDLSQAKDSSAWDWALAALQCGPGVDSFDRAIVTNTIKVAHQVKAGARVTPLTPQLLMQLGSEAVAAAQQQVLEEHKRLLQVEQDRATLREKIQQEMEQRWEHKAAQQATQRENELALALEKLKSQNASAQENLAITEAEVSRLKFKLQQEVQERVAAAKRNSVPPADTDWGNLENPDVPALSYQSAPLQTLPAGSERDGGFRFPTVRLGVMIFLSVLAGAIIGWWMRSEDTATPAPTVTLEKPVGLPRVVEECPAGMREAQASIDAMMELRAPLGRYREAASMMWAVSCEAVRPKACRDADIYEIERSLQVNMKKGPKELMTILKSSLPKGCRVLSERDTWVLTGQDSTLLRDAQTSAIDRSTDARTFVKGVQANTSQTKAGTVSGRKGTNRDSQASTSKTDTPHQSGSSNDLGKPMPSSDGPSESESSSGGAFLSQ